MQIYKIMQILHKEKGVNVRGLIQSGNAQARFNAQARQASPQKNLIQFNRSIYRANL